MRNILRSSLVIVLVLVIGLPQSGAQFVTPVKQLRQESNPAYMMFLGEGRDLMATTVKGFGSGLFDVFNERASIDLLRFGSSNVNITFGAGFSVNKYRFRDNLVFQKDDVNEMIDVIIDPVPEHEYSTSFFSYSKSKLVYGSVYVPAYLNIRMNEVMISAGAFYDYFLMGKLKSKYKVDGSKVPEKVPNAQFKDYYLNKGKIGFTFSVLSSEKNMGLAVTYMLTPFFMEGKGPSVNELRIGVVKIMGLPGSE